MELPDRNIKEQALIGMVRAVPIILGYLPIGLAFGVLASTAGLSIYSAVAMSVFVFAGSSQLIAVGLIGAGVEAAAIVMTVFLVNLRHMLMSAYLAPYLGHLNRLEQAFFSYELTDESFAIHSAFFRQNSVPPKIELFTLNISAQMAWVAGTLAGSWVGGRLTFELTAYGIDYALPAMFIALLVLQIDSSRRVAIAALSAGLGLILYLSGMNQLYIILATIVAATVGALFGPEPKDRFQRP